MGKLVFLDLVDRSGRIQVICDTSRDRRARRPPRRRRRRRRPAGEVAPRRAVASLAESVEVLSRNTQPLPDTFHGLTDVELRYRKRYLDLLMNEETRETFVTRAKVVTAIRRALDEWGFVEVETPILQPRYGGAFARPFVDPSQRARRRLLPPDRDRAVPQAADRRRARARLRDRQGLPQRGRLVQAQPRVHDARVVRGVRRLPRHDGPDRAARRAGRARGARDDARDVPRPRDRARRPVGARPLRRGARAARALDARRRRAPRVADRARGRHGGRQGLDAARRPCVLPLRRAGPDPADDRPRLPGRALAVRAADRRRPDADRAIRVLRRRDGARERVHGDQRGGDAAGALRPAVRRRSRASGATRTTSRRSPTGCRRPAGSASASTAS